MGEPVDPAADLGGDEPMKPDPLEFVASETASDKPGTTTVTYFVEAAARASSNSFHPFIIHSDAAGAAVTRGVASAADFFYEAFLPEGYPDSVSPDYLEYQLWDTAQAFCSYITGTLASQAVLKGVGVGDKEATAVGATVTYLMRDVTGMVGKIVFAWAKGTDLDKNAKRWRLIADILNDIALLIDLLAPFFPLYFVFLVCISSLLRAVVGVAGGATRAALTMHQARSDNMADVSAKDGSQETLVNLVAVVIGMVLVPAIDGNVLVTWCVFLVAAILHIFCNYRAVSCVVLQRLNNERLRLCVEQYGIDGTVPTPDEAAALEPLFPRSTFVRTRVGVSFAEAIANETEFKITQLAAKLAPGSSNYLMGYGLESYTNPSSMELLAVLHSNATTQDTLRAYFHAFSVAHAFKKAPGNAGALEKGPLGGIAQNILNSENNQRYWGMLMKQSAEYTEQHFSQFCDIVKAAGWELEHTQLTTEPYRCQWKELMEVVD